MQLTSALSVLITLFAGAFLQAKMGVGIGIVAMMVLPSLFGFQTSVGLSLVMALACSFSIVLKDFRHIRWKVILPMFVVSLPISIASAYLSFETDQVLLKVIFGAVLVLLAIYFCWFSDRIHVRPTLPIGLGVGVIAGIGNGFFGISGPPAALYTMSAIEENRAYVASMQAFFFFSNIVVVITHLFSGSITTAHLPYIPVGWAGALAGAMLGRRAFKNLSGPVMKRIVYAFVALCGIITILQTLGVI